MMEKFDILVADSDATEREARDGVGGRACASQIGALVALRAS